MERELAEAVDRVALGLQDPAANYSGNVPEAIYSAGKKVEHGLAQLAGSMDRVAQAIEKLARVVELRR